MAKILDIKESKFVLEFLPDFYFGDKQKLNESGFFIQMRNTKIINVFGAPGSGKSTFASFLFAKMKCHGIDCELITEFAKELVWQGRKDIFDDPTNQFYIGANQFFRVNSMIGKTDYLVTDSPILLSAIYNRSTTLGWRYDEIVIDFQHELDSDINYLMIRTKPYVQNGRNEDSEEALKLHEKIEWLLSYNGFYCRKVEGGEETFESEWKILAEKEGFLR